MAGWYSAERLATPLFDRLRALIEPRHDEMIADLARFVAVPTGHNHAPGLDTMRALVVARLEALGAQCELIPGDPRPDWLTEDGAGRFDPPPTAVCRRPYKDRPRIMLAGHLDTVFDPNGPFRSMAVLQGGQRAVGPGVVDMKGGILIALVALEALEEACVGVSWSFLLNSDEETGSYASDKALRSVASRHDYGIALEPALPDGGLAVQRKGSGQFLIEAHGRSAHAGRDFEKGASAVYALARAIGAVEAMTDLPRGVTLNIGPLRGGEATNIVPAYAAAWGNARYPDEESARALGERLDALNTPEEAVPRIVLRRSFSRPAKPLTPETERLALAARGVAEALGQSLPFGASGGVCDGNNMQAAGLPTIDTMGVRGGGLHTHDEWIDLSSLTERACLLACLLAELSGER